ncbi:putative RNA-directed DNA polymerase from transposon X-element [Trichonephila clavipes]|nr:putative RNA-directed DNA polymerase from transposon X-element [Trichonephila clavipes]
MVQNRAVDEAVFNVTEAIRNAADAAIPKTSNSPRKLCKPWWNASCQQAKRNKGGRGVFSGGTPTSDNLIAFKRAKALARRIRRQCQRESWIQYVSSITSSTTSQQLWRKVKAANGLYRDFNIPILETSTALSPQGLTFFSLTRMFAVCGDPYRGKWSLGFLLRALWPMLLRRREAGSEPAPVSRLVISSAVSNTGSFGIPKTVALGLKAYCS